MESKEFKALKEQLLSCRQQRLSTGWTRRSGAPWRSYCDGLQGISGH